MTGMDAFQMHRSQVSNDAQYISQIIGRFTFCELATVLNVDGEHVDCKVGDVTYTNVEILVLGTKSYAVKVTPTVGDKVLLLCPRSVITDMITMLKVDDIPKYDIAGLKCIPLADSEASQKLEITERKLSLTGANKLTLDSNGIAVEDSNKNKFTMSSEGVKIEDSNGNDIAMASGGVTINGKLKVGN